jgi:plastocyanin
MRPDLPGTGIAIPGIILLFAVIAAGCTSSPYGPTPATTTATPATPLPTIIETTVATTATTVPSTTALTTPATTVVQTTAPPTLVTITIQNFTFSPASVTVPLGSTVTWTNLDAAAHQISSDTHAFLGNPLSQGSSYSFTFMSRGTFPYHCAIHPSMKGTVTVT